MKPSEQAAEFGTVEPLRLITHRPEGRNLIVADKDDGPRERCNHWPTGFGHCRRDSQRTPDRLYPVRRGDSNDDPDARVTEDLVCPTPDELKHAYTTLRDTTARRRKATPELRFITSCGRTLIVAS
jgi:hypothetical protein